MNYEIRSVNMRYKDDEVETARVIYTARNKDRTVTINGNFDLTAVEYAKNEAVEQLEVMAKEHLMSEVSAN